MTGGAEILIIDDNVENLEVLTEALARASYQVAAVSKREAVA